MPPVYARPRTTKHRAAGSQVRNSILRIMRGECLWPTQHGQPGNPSKRKDLPRKAGPCFSVICFSVSLSQKLNVTFAVNARGVT